MRIIADENLHRQIILVLRSIGYDVLSVQEECAGIDDEEVISRFSGEDAVIITQDKDFGDLTFLKKIQSNSVILLRFDASKIGLMIAILSNFLNEHSLEDLKNKFVVLTPVKKRVRDIPGKT